MTTDQVVRAHQLRAVQFMRMSAFLERFDVLILPVSQVLPFPVEEDWPRSIAGVPMATYIDWMQSCSLITMTSHPALSLPCGFTPEGLPVGAQIVGRYRGEADLLAFAAAWEAALGVSSRRPTLASLDSLFGTDRGRIKVLGEIIEPIDVEWEALREDTGDAGDAGL